MCTAREGLTHENGVPLVSHTCIHQWLQAFPQCLFDKLRGLEQVANEAKQQVPYHYQQANRRLIVDGAGDAGSDTAKAGGATGGF